MDSSLRRLLLAQLTSETVSAGDSLVIPETLRVQRVPDQQFRQYKETLGGLTTENEVRVRAKLQEVGVIPGAGVLA